MLDRRSRFWFRIRTFAAGVFAFVAVSSAAAASIADWVDQLEHRQPAVRAAAAESLFQAGANAKEAVFAASESERPEAARQAVLILERWAFGDAAALGNDADGEAASEAAAATPVDEAATVQAPISTLAEEAERQLAVLLHAEGGEMAPLAYIVLIRHRDERKKRALAAIERLGGEVVYSNRGFYDSVVPLNGRPRLGRMPFRSPQRLAEGERLLSRIKITADWTGGDAGLYHLTRLEHADDFDIRVEGAPAGLSFTAVTALQAQLDNVKLDFVSPATLGIKGEPSTPLRVEAVTPGGSCDLAGVRSGDIIRKLGPHPVRSLPHVKGLLMNYRPGETVPVVIERAGREITLDVTLQDWTKNDTLGAP